MTDWHPSASSLELFMRGEMDSSASRDLVLHLLGGCSSCREIAGSYAIQCGKSPNIEQDLEAVGAVGKKNTSSYGDLFERVLPTIWKADEAVVLEKDAAPGLVEELRRHPRERRFLIVKNSRRYQTWAVCEALLQCSHGAGQAAEEDSLSFLELAASLGETLDRDQYGSAQVNDLLGRTYSLLGNARRMRSDFVGAREALDIASSFLEAGTGDELESARLLNFRGALLADQQRFDLAFEALDKAISIYRRLGQRDEEARVQMVKGMHLGNAGFPDRAVKHLRLGLRLVDANENPRLELVGKHNLIDNLYRSGRYHQALAMVPETRELHRRLGNPTDLTKFSWLEALIARESGEMERAEETFNTVKQFFLDKGWPHEVALVSLDLSMILLRQGRSKDLQDLAAEMLVIFQGLRIHREAIAALVLFQKAVQMERATAGLVRDLAAYLKNSRHNPHLPFRPSSNA